jgi:serine phosphatase RsbU (regulator of sigma subunit)
VRAFPSGSTLVLCTDGLIERRGESIDEGLARLAQAVTRDRARPVDEICDLLIEELLPEPERHDDVAIIAARLVTTQQPAISTVP